MSLRFASLVGAFVFLLTSLSTATHTIHWSADTISEIYDSAAGQFPESWTISIGTFGALGDTFSPDLANTSAWTANWVELDSTNYEMVNPPFSTFQGTVAVVDIERANEQVYMWAYNNQAGDETSEWALVTSAAWTMADALDLAPSQAGPIDEWILQTGDTAVWGRLNQRLPDTSRFVLEGGGVRLSEPPVSFDLQTQLLVNPVPEPSVVLSLALAGMGMLALRRPGRS